MHTLSDLFADSLHTQMRKQDFTVAAFADACVLAFASRDSNLPGRRGRGNRARAKGGGSLVN